MSEQKAKERFAPIKTESELRMEEQKKDSTPTIYLVMSTCGLASGAAETKQAFEEALSEKSIQARIIPVGCLGHCYAEPLVIIDHPGAGFPPICYYQINADRARILVRSYLEGGDPVLKYVLGAMEENDVIPAVMDFPRFNLEQRLVMEHCGLIDPDDIHQYIARGGYSALVKALDSTPDEVIDLIAQSGLRGRGGAGFPTGRKWRIAKTAEADGKFVICNGDEGDPGAYMDRTILESNPHQLLEGLAICAYAVGADRAIVYVRAEYPLAVKAIKQAIKSAEELSLLGPSILGTSFDLQVSVFQGSGAFVCGEETALIQSIEGKRGMPQHRPPFPVEKGLWGQPTVVNNVKTLSAVPSIMLKGPQWFLTIGTERSPGTAIFSVVGNVKHPGLVEIAMGTSLRTLIFDVCGGIPKKKEFKAVQIGGPSGGCLPASFLDTPIDFDSLTRAGAMMGSGGMVVMDEDSCMVDVSRYFLDFTQKESCGKCTFCRMGTNHLLNILERITKGEGREKDLEILETLSQDIKDGSLCGLGKTAPNPVLTSLKYFRDEYQAHIKEKRCPAGVCKALFHYEIDGEACTGCHLCAIRCPQEAIRGEKKEAHELIQEKCIKCGICYDACKFDAVLVK